MPCMFPRRSLVINFGQAETTFSWTEPHALLVMNVAAWNADNHGPDPELHMVISIADLRSCSRISEPTFVDKALYEVVCKLRRVPIDREVPKSGQGVAVPLR